MVSAKSRTLGMPEGERKRECDANAASRVDEIDRLCQDANFCEASLKGGVNVTGKFRNCILSY